MREVDAIASYFFVQREVSVDICQSSSRRTIYIHKLPTGPDRSSDLRSRSSAGHSHPTHMEPVSPVAGASSVKRAAMAFVPASSSMLETSRCLERVALVEAFGRPIEEDDVQSALVRMSRISGSWTIRKLFDPSMFFIACPSRVVVHQLMADDRIKGDGFRLQVSHWDQYK